MTTKLDIVLVTAAFHQVVKVKLGPSRSAEVRNEMVEPATTYIEDMQIRDTHSDS